MMVPVCQDNGITLYHGEAAQAEYVVMGLLGSLGREQEREGECLPGVLRVNRSIEEKGYHMHAKPVALMTTLLKPLTWLHAEGSALDPFVGSGNTLIAARQLGLQCVGIEREAENVAMLRLCELFEQAGLCFDEMAVTFEKVDSEAVPTTEALQKLTVSAAALKAQSDSGPNLKSTPWERANTNAPWYRRLQPRRRS